MRASTLLLCALLCSASLCGCLGQTNLLVNGDFESCTSNQTLSLLRGTGPVGWYYPEGRYDPQAGYNTIGFTSNASSVPGPSGWSYSGWCALTFGGEVEVQGITQAVPVTAGTQYVLSFFIFYPDADASSTYSPVFNATYQWNTATSPTLLMDQRSYPSLPPFYWTQFKYTITPPAGVSSVNITFNGEDPFWSFWFDYATFWPGDLSAAPPPPPAIKPNPANNLLINGDFEAGGIAPFAVPQDDAGGAPIPGGYVDIFAAGSIYGYGCPQGQWCMYNGATNGPLAAVTTVTGLQCGVTYTLSFQFICAGGYNGSNPGDTGSGLQVSYGYGSQATTVGFTDAYNRSAAYGSQSSPISQSFSMGAATQTSVTVSIAAYMYATSYLIDFVQVTPSGGTAGSCSPPPSNGAAPAAAQGAFQWMGVVGGAVALSLLLAA